MNHQPTRSDRLLLLIIRLAACGCFAGWTWVHYYWEAPYGSLLWQDTTYRWASYFQIDWDQFVGSGANDGLIQIGLARTTWLYLACTLLTITVRKGRMLQIGGLLLGSLLLTVLSYAKYVSAQRQLPMFVEHGGQMLVPILLVFAVQCGVRHRATVIIAIIAVITTFTGHGSYAVGLWPTPANFYGMTTVILQADSEQAKLFLLVFGLLDFVTCLAILVAPVRRLAAAYATFWGFLTALARPVAGMSTSIYYWGADQYIHEAILRAPHWLIPLYLFFLWKQPSVEKADEPITSNATSQPPRAALLHAHSRSTTS